MENETIEIFFEKETENIAWEKRAPRKIIATEVFANEESLESNNNPINKNEAKETIPEIKKTNILKKSPHNSQSIASKTIRNIDSQNKPSKRGLEIQKELENLKYEVKRKDLNPIEKENLQNLLIKLKKEMTNEVNNFSKADDIHTRINQIGLYLSKLENDRIQVKEKIKVETSQISQKTDLPIAQNKILNKKMKTIFHFGL